MRRGSALVALAVLAVLAAPAAAAAAPITRQQLEARTLVRTWTISYLAHDGRTRHAYVVLPSWYGPRRHPPLPLVLSPHGRGVPAETNAKIWDDLPSIGQFAVVNPEGQGRVLTLYSWGDPGEIHDLARMPAIAKAELPWLRIDDRRVYAFGSSMGGQETLLLLAEYPRLLAGAAAFDSATNLAARFHEFSYLPFGASLRRKVLLEVGGTPWSDPHAWALRSPIDWADQIAFSNVPLQLWWSTRDRIVVDQGSQQSGLLYRVVRRLNPNAPVRAFVGTWAHSADFRATAYLPDALALYGLMPPFRAHAPGLAP